MNMVFGDLIGAVTGVANSIVKPLAQPFKELDRLTNEIYDDNDDLMELSRRHSRSASLANSSEAQPVKKEKEEVETSKTSANDVLRDNINHNLQSTLTILDKLEKGCVVSTEHRHMKTAEFIAMVAMIEFARINIDKIKKDVEELNGKKKEEGEDNGC